MGDVGSTAALGLRVGEAYAGSSLPRIGEWFHRFDVTAPDGSAPQTTMGELGDTPAGRVTFETAGFHRIAYESSRDFVELKPAKFNDYLRAEGIGFIIDRRSRLGEADLPARELYSRSAKALLQAGPDAQFAVQRVGLPFELTLLDPPRGDGPRRFEIRFRDQPMQGVLVRAIPRANPQAVVGARSDADGRVSLELDGRGEWLVKAVHMERAADADRQRADWESWWASLTFYRH